MNVNKITIERRTINIDTSKRKSHIKWKFVKIRLPRKKKKMFGDDWRRHLFTGWFYDVKNDK